MLTRVGSSVKEGKGEDGQCAIIGNTGREEEKLQARRIKKGEKKDKVD